jgi:hypothetical protein
MDICDFRGNAAGECPGVLELVIARDSSNVTLLRWRQADGGRAKISMLGRSTG